MVQKINLNILLDAMIIMLLDHYAWSFHKWLAILKNLKVIQQLATKIVKRYNQMWNRVEKLLKIKFDSEPVYGDNDKHIKKKIKIYGGSVNTNFHGKSVPKEKAPSKCLSIIMLDSVVKAKKNRNGGMQIWSKKDKNGEPYWWWFRKSLSDVSDKEADNDFNDDTKFDDEKDNDEFNK